MVGGANAGVFWELVNESLKLSSVDERQHGPWCDVCRVDTHHLEDCEHIQLIVGACRSFEELAVALQILAAMVHQP